MFLLNWQLHLVSERSYHVTIQLKRFGFELYMQNRGYVTGLAARTWYCRFVLTFSISPQHSIHEAS